MKKFSDCLRNYEKRQRNCGNTWSNFLNQFRMELPEQNKEKSQTTCAKNWKAN